MVDAKLLECVLDLLRALATSHHQINQITHRLLEDADVNNVGLISLSEKDEQLLHLYIHINRQAPISPPTREKVQPFFLLLEHDLDHDEQLNEVEFINFLKPMSQRAATTLMAHKFVTVIGTPWLTEVAMKFQLLPRVFTFVLPAKQGGQSTTRFASRVSIDMAFIFCNHLGRYSSAYGQLGLRFCAT